MSKSRSLIYIPVLLAFAALASADNSVGARINGIEIGKTTPAPAENAAETRSNCVNHCNTADSRCNSEIRRASSQCQHRAATAGRDPFTGRADNAYFCGYFNNSGRCGPSTASRGCQDRYARTYGLCVDRMQDNIASMRFDCYANQRDAQNFCRDELQACKATCEQM
ncbi:MAG TPA: hypothetical protein VGN07_20310 [Steroidobacteraceae bacterium]|jgi:hypothetical protein